ncbi:MAG: PadR family transcriptional regulator [Phycisphaerae bacterium]|nr:PadR family transcriptional regulator [Phycisphaerae bacterium]
MKGQSGLSMLSLAILGVIRQQPQTGYDIRKLFATTPLGHIRNSPGAIYPALKRLDDAGWIRGQAGHGKTRVQRVVYEITPAGLETLEDHLSEPVTQDDVTWRMDDVLLRFAFMEPVIGREATLRFLGDFVSQIDTHVAGLRGYLDSVRDLMPVCGRLAMENGIQSYEMNARWARRAIAELGGD